MPETYIVTVKTEDGRCWIQTKICGDCLDSFFPLPPCSHISSLRLRDLRMSMTLLGSGTPSSASDSPSPTES